MPSTATSFTLRLRLHYKAARVGGVIHKVETMGEIGTMLLLGSLLINLVAGPYYYRKLHRHIEALEQHAPCTYETLQKPSLEMLGFKMSASRSMSLVSHVWKKSYKDTSNEAVILTGGRAYRGLMISTSAMVVMFLGAALIMLSSPSV